VIWVGYGMQAAKTPTYLVNFHMLISTFCCTMLS